MSHSTTAPGDHPISPHIAAPATMDGLAALAAEHALLLRADREAWRELDRHAEESPGREEASARWCEARAALEAFPARLAAVSAADGELIRFKAHVLSGIHDGDLGFAVLAAAGAAAERGVVADEALALSIARDVLLE